MIDDPQHPHLHRRASRWRLHRCALPSSGGTKVGDLKANLACLGSRRPRRHTDLVRFSPHYALDLVGSEEVKLDRHMRHRLAAARPSFQSPARRSGSKVIPSAGAKLVLAHREDGMFRAARPWKELYPNHMPVDTDRSSDGQCWGVYLPSRRSSSGGV